MDASNTFEQGIQELVFQNIAFTGIGDAGGLLPSAVAGNLYLSLHTADPGEAGDQTTNEAAYTNYARVAVARDNVQWDVTAGVASIQNTATFPQAGVTAAEILTHVGIGTDSAGAGQLLFSGALSSSLNIDDNVTPEITSLTITVD